jgi:putative ABC transport system ATP-binding protein
MSETTFPAPIVEAIGLTKTFQQKHLEVPVLRGVDITIGASEFTVIAGPSGSGKTTLLNMLGLLDVPTSGWLSFGGNDLSGSSPTDLAALRRDHVGFVFQAYNLMPVLTAAENTEMVLEFQGVPPALRRARSTEVLRQLGMQDLMHRFPDQLSGGQQQRVAVARAIASKPLLVIADEPTANLDSRTAEQLMDLMTALNTDHGITFIFSSHDPHVIGRGRRVVTLQDGRIVADTAQGQTHAA